MSVFVVTVGAGGAAVSIPESSVAALRLPGASNASLHTTDGFACAAARTRADSDPLRVENGVVVVGDIRLDGRADLIRALRGVARGEGPPARGGESPADDTALVIAAYRAWGDAFVEHLRGDFSFVLWDGSRRTFVAARDGLGVRPLYYATIPGGICASNALDAVRAHPAVRAAIHAPAIVSFLEHGWNRDTSTTTFAAIARLPAGSLLRQSGGAHRVETHWRMPDPGTLIHQRESEYIEQYRALLGDAVRDRLGADTMLLLSGGLDSTSIATTARRVAPEAGLFAVTTRVPECESPDEARLAGDVAARAGITHSVREWQVNPLAGTRLRTPEPYDDPELAANSAFYRLVESRSHVAIQGEDGDALFTPPSFAEMARRDGAAQTAGRVAAYTIRHGRRPHLGFGLGRRLRWWRRPPTVGRPRWLRSTAGESPPEPEAPRSVARPSAASRLGSSIWQSVHDGVDRAYTGAAVEFRWPLLDLRLVEFVFAIPAVPWCQRKELVRRAFARDLPAEVITRPKTTVPGFFELAVATWRRRTGATAGALDERTLQFVDAASLDACLRSGDTEEVLAGWRAIQLDQWFRHQGPA